MENSEEKNVMAGVTVRQSPSFEIAAVNNSNVSNKNNGLLSKLPLIK